MKPLSIMIAATMIASGASAQVKLSPKNIDQVVKEMTIEEKATLMVGYTFGNSYFGLPTNPDPNAGAIVLGAAGNTASIDRLGIPHTVLADGPAGLHIAANRPGDSQTYYCTGFPIGTLLASTWNTPLVEQVGRAMGNEVLEYGCDVILGPGMNLMRSPLCGRNFEYYSEDPFLTGYIAAAMVNGVQSQGVGVSAKHFAANNQESNRLYNNSIVSQRALRELYLKGFEIVVRKSQPWTIMSSYNYLNGPWTQENKELLTTILRDEWGFKGIVMTDWTNTRHTDRQVAAGNDLLTPGNAAQIQAIVKGANDGTISMADIDRNVRRILEYVVKTPHFRGYKFSNKPDIEAHAKLTREVAPEGMVLLKNENVLPFAAEQPKKDGKRPTRAALFGITSYMFYAGGTGSGDVNKPYVIDLQQGLKNAGIATDDTLTTVYTKYKEFGMEEVEAEMGPLSPNKFFPRPRLREPQLGKNVYSFAASNNDVAIITVGRSSGEGGDRSWDDFNINADEMEMLRGVAEAFHAKQKPVVVILNVGGAVETNSWSQLADAILLAWQPGMEGGNSVADVLTGRAYPSGKLPMTFPCNLEDIPSTKNFPKDYTFWDDMRLNNEQKAQVPFIRETVYEEGLDVGYRYFQTKNQPVSYPFGFGLTYTTFEYSQAKVSKKGSSYVAQLTVKNTGSRAGKETVQLYVAAPKGQLEKPAYELRAFAKTRELKPGESQRLEMTFTAYDLASYDEGQQAWVTDGGTYTALFSASAEDIRARSDFKVKAAKVAAHDVLRPAHLDK
ncbi:MAG: glycoside hydrolase family 3 C-terminal domain-containing protein [Prevotella sp.]|nr:glycoside hydrolase family 3 C-terminal domain-containing protein [Prevotella sp.]